MVLHVLADAEQLMDHRHADLAEMLRVANARELQDMRRADRAGRKDHLAPGVGALDLAAARKLDADRALALEDNAVDHRVGHELKVARFSAGRR